MKITGISSQKRQGRINLYIDGEFALGLHQDIFYQSPFHEGDEITEEDLRQFQKEEDILKAKDKALKLLGYRARSTSEIRTRLKQAGFEEIAIHNVIEDLSRTGLLNDTEFAEAFARTKLVQRPAGRFLIHQELRGKGIDEKIIEKTLNQIYEETSEKDLAEQLIQKRLSRLQDSDDPKEKKRLTDLLRRRGFNWDIIEQILL